MESKGSTTTASCRVILLYNAMIVTMDPSSRVFRNGGLLVSGDRIEAIGQSPDILRDFSHRADEVIDLAGRVLLPGLVNTHVHTSQQLARGIADDVDLVTWLHDRIWPYESHLTEEDSYLSTLLCGIELIRSGVTCFAEAGGQHVAGMARAVELLGLRACLTQSTMDSGEGLPANWSVQRTDQCIQSQKELYSKYHNTADGRIRIWFGLRQIMNATDQLLFKTRDIAEELKTGIHMHVAEIPFENQLVRETRNVDHGTVTYLEKIGLLSSNLLAAHSVWLNDTEIGFFSRAGVKVSHCPAAAMRMLGFAPIKEMLDAGVCVSIGTDGAPSNNRMSMVDEMYLASLINKGRQAYISGTTDPTVVPAEVVLKMATVNGAKSVLWDNEIGSLEVRKKGLEKAVKELIPHVEHMNCTRHIYSNLRKEHGTEAVRNAFYEASMATHPEAFKTAMKKLERLSKGAAEKMNIFDPKAWSKAYFQTWSKTDSTENNISECFNS